MSVAAEYPANYTQQQPSPSPPSQSQTPTTTMTNNQDDSALPSPSPSSPATLVATDAVGAGGTTTDINSNRTAASSRNTDSSAGGDLFDRAAGGDPSMLTSKAGAGQHQLQPHQLSPPSLHKGNSDGVTVLMYACQQDRETDVRALLSQKPFLLEAKDRTGKTALHYCAENETPTCADLLLSQDRGLLDVQDNDGYSALHLAVIAGNTLFIKYLISKGAGLNLLDSELHSVVHWAAVCGELEALDILLEAGANPTTPDIHGAHPVHYAAQMCGPDQQNLVLGELPGGGPRVGLLTLKKLLSKRVPVTVVDQDGRPPLLWAASSGSDDAILALVNAGASVEAADKDGLTALHCAASRGHMDCLETLANLCGAEVDVIDANGCSPLFYAVTLGHADCTKLLLKYGAQPNRQDRKGRTPAHCGAAKGQWETLKLLASHGGDVWVRNIRGDLPLHEAVQSGRRDLVVWMLEQKPESVNAANNDGRCPLHIAAINDNIEMCKVLLDLQASVNPIMRSSKGQLATPLDAALHRGNRNTAKYLQLHGAVPAHKLTDKNALQRALALASAGQDLDYLKSSTATSPSVMTDEGVQTEERLRHSKDSQAYLSKHRSRRETERTTEVQRRGRTIIKGVEQTGSGEREVEYSSEDYEYDNYDNDDGDEYYDDEDEEEDVVRNRQLNNASNKTNVQKKKHKFVDKSSTKTASKTSSEFVDSDKKVVKTDGREVRAKNEKALVSKPKEPTVAAGKNGEIVTKSVSSKKSTSDGGKSSTVTTVTTRTSRKVIEYEKDREYYSGDEEYLENGDKSKYVHVNGAGRPSQNFEPVNVDRRRSRHETREDALDVKRGQNQIREGNRRRQHQEVREEREYYESSEYGHASLDPSEAASGGKDSGFSENYGSVRVGAVSRDGASSREHFSVTPRSDIDSRDQTRASSKETVRRDISKQGAHPDYRAGPARQAATRSDKDRQLHTKQPGRRRANRIPAAEDISESEESAEDDQDNNEDNSPQGRGSRQRKGRTKDEGQLQRATAGTTGTGRLIVSKGNSQKVTKKQDYPVAHSEEDSSPPRRQQQVSNVSGRSTVRKREDQSFSKKTMKNVRERRMQDITEEDTPSSTRSRVRKTQYESEEEEDDCSPSQRQVTRVRAIRGEDVRGRDSQRVRELGSKRLSLIDDRTRMRKTGKSSSPADNSRNVKPPVKKNKSPAGGRSVSPPQKKGKISKELSPPRKESKNIRRGFSVDDDFSKPTKSMQGRSKMAKSETDDPSPPRKPAKAMKANKKSANIPTESSSNGTSSKTRESSSRRETEYDDDKYDDYDGLSGGYEEELEEDLSRGRRVKLKHSDSSKKRSKRESKPKSRSRDRDESHGYEDFDESDQYESAARDREANISRTSRKGEETRDRKKSKIGKRPKDEKPTKREEDVENESFEDNYNESQTTESKRSIREKKLRASSDLSEPLSSKSKMKPQTMETADSSSKKKSSKSQKREKEYYSEGNDDQEDYKASKVLKSRRRVKEDPSSSKSQRTSEDLSEERTATKKRRSTNKQPRCEDARVARGSKRNKERMGSGNNGSFSDGEIDKSEKKRKGSQGLSKSRSDQHLTSRTRQNRANELQSTVSDEDDDNEEEDITTSNEAEEDSAMDEAGDINGAMLQPAQKSKTKQAANRSPNQIAQKDGGRKPPATTKTGSSIGSNAKSRASKAPRVGSAKKSGLRKTGAPGKKKKSDQVSAKAKLVTGAESKTGLSQTKTTKSKPPSMVDNIKQIVEPNVNKASPEQTSKKKQNDVEPVLEPVIVRKEAKVNSNGVAITSSSNGNNSDSGKAGSTQVTKALVHRNPTSSDEVVDPAKAAAKDIEDGLEQEPLSENGTARNPEEEQTAAAGGGNGSNPKTEVSQNGDKQMISTQVASEVTQRLELESTSEHLQSVVSVVSVMEKADDAQAREQNSTGKVVPPALEEENGATLTNGTQGQAGVTKPRKMSANGKKQTLDGKGKGQRPRLTTPSKASMASKNTFKGKPSKTLKQMQNGQKQSPGHLADGDGTFLTGPGSLEVAMATRNGSIPINPNDPVAIRNKVRKYELERRIFSELLELKRLQVRSGKANEQVLVKRLVDTYKKEGLLGVKTYDGPYTFASFEKHLYDQLKSLQNPQLLKGLSLKPPKDDQGQQQQELQQGGGRSSEAVDSAKIKRELSAWMQGRIGLAADPAAAADLLLLQADGDPLNDAASTCTHRTHTCHHAAHAYTGVPCAAYITRPNHHHAIKGPARPFLPKIERRVGVGAAAAGGGTDPVDLRNFDPSRPLTLELNHGGQRQLIEFPANRLDKNRKYHVTFTIKPTTPIAEEADAPPPPAPLRKPMPAGVSVQELQKQLSSL